MKNRLKNPIRIILILFAIFAVYVSSSDIDLQFYSAMVVYALDYAIQYFAPFIGFAVLIITAVTTLILRARAASTLNTLDMNDADAVRSVKRRLRKAAIFTMAGHIINTAMFWIHFPTVLDHGTALFLFSFAVWGASFLFGRFFLSDIKRMQQLVTEPTTTDKCDMTRWPFNFTPREQHEMGGAAYLAINSFNQFCSMLMIILSLVNLLCGDTATVSPMITLGIVWLGMNALFWYHRTKIEK